MSDSLAEERLVVLSCGSYGTKGGVANVLAPSFQYFPYVAEHPVERGIIKDFVRLCGHWSQIAASGLDFKITDREHPVLLLCPVSWSKYDYENITKFFFEHLGVPALCLLPTPIACLLGCNVVTGLVVDIGYETIELTPVFETNVMVLAAVTLPVGMRDVFELFRDLCRDIRQLPVPELDTTHQLAVLEVALGVDEELLDSETIVNGESHKFGRERYKCFEVLFDPSIKGLSVLAFRETMWRLIRAVDPHMRKSILENVVLSGAGASVKGMQRRVENEITNVLPLITVFTSDNSSLQTRCRDIPFYLEQFHRQPEKSWWVGGSVLAKLAFSDAVRSSITRDEYDAQGPSVIHTKSYGVY